MFDIGKVLRYLGNQQTEVNRKTTLRKSKPRRRLQPRVAMQRAVEPVESRIMLAGFTVSGINPATNAFIDHSVNSVTVTFNNDVLTSSIDAADLKINGVSASSYSVVDSRNVTWSFPSVGEGAQSISIAAAALQDQSNVGLTAFASTFTVDTTPVKVLSTSVAQGGSVDAGPLTINVKLTEKLLNGGAGLSAGTFKLVGSVSGEVTPDGVAYDNATQTGSLTFNSLTGDQSFTLTISAADVKDRAGWSLDGNGDGVGGDDFSLNFGVNAPATVVPGQFTKINPPGSLIYDPLMSDTIDFAGDVDSYTRALDAHQTVSVVVSPSANLKATAWIVDANGNTVGDVATSSAPGKKLVLQTAPIAVAGTYTLKIAGVDGTTGTFDAKVFLNAALDVGAHGGADHSSIGSAQNIDGSFISLADGASRGAVVGSIDPTTDTYLYDTGTQWTSVTVWYYSGWQTFPLDFNVASHQPAGDGTVYIYANLYNYDPPKVEDENRVEWWNSGTGGFVNGVFTYPMPYSLSSQWAADNVITWNPMNDTVRTAGQIGVRMTYPVEYTVQGKDDFYAVSLNAGQVATFALTGNGGITPSLELYNASGQLVSSGTVKNTNVSEVIRSFVTPSTGTYYVRVVAPTGIQTSDYSLVVTKSAEFDVEGNNSIQTAYDMTPTNVALGHVSTGQTDDDYWQIQVGTAILGDAAPLKQIILQTYTPADGSGEFVNALNPRLYLYDPTGALVATDQDGAADGRNSLLKYTATFAGKYTVRVAPEAGTSGEYVLTSKVSDALPGVNVSPTTGLLTTGTGGTASFAVSLFTQPLSPVTVNLLSSRPDQGLLSTSSLVFTSSNWNVPQTVTVTGQDDNVVVGDQQYTVSGSTSSADSAYAGLAVPVVHLINQESDAAVITVTPTSGLVTTESGGTDSFNVLLSSKPTSAVTIPVSSSDVTAGVPSVSQLVFTPDNWNQIQTVTVTGVSDHVISGSRTYKIILGAAVTADASYSGMKPSDVSILNVNTDVAGVTVTPTSGLVTTEAGGTASFTMALTSKPSSNVTIALASDDTSHGVPNVSQVVFTPANWNVAQTVTVTGARDYVDNGNQAYDIITAAAVSSDANYSGLEVADVSLLNIDIDTAGITVSPGAITTTKGGGTGTFSVVLNSKPTAPVSIDLNSSRPGEGSLSVPALTFTPANWNVPQVVTVTGKNNEITTGSVGYTIATSIAVSADAAYNGTDAGDVSVTNIDDVAPVVTRVLVRGSAWNTSTFLPVLDDNVLGYSIPSGSGATQLKNLPWVNINRVTIVFSEAVSVNKTDLALAGVNVANYTITGFSYDPARHAATWNLATIIGPDKLLISLSDSVTDISGNKLDGEWDQPTGTTDPTSDTFPSGDGVAGGIFRFRFNVLPGDADQNAAVSGADQNYIKTKLGSQVGNSAYSILMDIDGNGTINANDENNIKLRLFSQLPVGNPTAIF